MKIVFIGWNDNGEKCLSSVLHHKFNVVSVISPEGYESRRMQIITKKHSIQFTSLGKNSNRTEKEILLLKPDLIIIASYPWLLSKRIIEYPRLGTINVHASLLPKYRGYHPLNWALIRDERWIGVTIHYVDSGADSGDIIAQESIEVVNSSDVISIRNTLTTIGARLLVEVLTKIRQKNKKIIAAIQRDSDATFAPCRNPDDGRIKWANNSRDIFNLVRALKSPYPNAFSYNKKKAKIEFYDRFLSKTPGKVLAKIQGHYLITTGDGVILLRTRNKLKIGELLV